MQRLSEVDPKASQGVCQRLRASGLTVVAEGNVAPMVLVRASPLQGIRNAQQIESAFLRGHYFRRDNLDHLPAEAKDLRHK